MALNLRTKIFVQKRCINQSKTIQKHFTIGTNKYMIIVIIMIVVMKEQIKLLVAENYHHRFISTTVKGDDVTQ